MYSNIFRHFLLALFVMDILQFRLILWIVMLVKACSLHAQVPSEVITFNERVFDFGKFKEQEGKVSHSFTFHNKGKVPVAIEHVATGCGCVSFEYSKEPVRPGNAGSIVVTYNPTHRPGFFSKEIVVLSNNRKSYNRIWIKGDVIPSEYAVKEDYPYCFGSGLCLNLKVLAFGKVIRNQSKQIKLLYANDTKKPMSLDFYVEGNDQRISFVKPKDVAPQKRGELNITYTQTSQVLGENVIRIWPIVNGKKLSSFLLVKAMGN